MKTPPSHYEDHDPLAEALRRDAARVQEPPFDPVVHHATLRRIRAMEDSGERRWRRNLVLTGVAAALVLALCIGWWLPRASQNIAQRTAAPPAIAQPAAGKSAARKSDTVQHMASTARPDFTALLASTQKAVDRLSTASSSPLPDWMSPTAALLDPPYLPSTIHTEHPQ